MFDFNADKILFQAQTRYEREFLDAWFLIDTSNNRHIEFDHSFLSFHTHCLARQNYFHHETTAGVDSV